MTTDPLNVVFEGAELFLDLLLKHSQRNNHVLSRYYSNGTWYQLSGRDFCAHLGRATIYWEELLNPKSFEPGKSILFLCRNSYTSFVATCSALLCGFDVMHAPVHMSKTDIEWCLKYFKGTAIATDIDELESLAKNYSTSLINISTASWVPQDRHPEPPLLSLYREYKTGWSSRTELRWRSTKIGRLAFVSFGHDGFQKPEILKLDALVTTAQNFIANVQVPKNIFWKSMELMAPSNPFAHLSRLCVLIQNGVIGFPNNNADWETNLRILRPTFIFSSAAELNQVYEFANGIAKQKNPNLRFKVSKLVDKFNNVLSLSKSMRISESTRNVLKKNILGASRLIAGHDFLSSAIEDLRFIVHGLAPAQESAVKSLEKLGLPIIETYGTTHSAGMLSSNTFHSPKFNTIGSPLLHVNFRLGENSTLEYRISSDAFEQPNEWIETGDVAQMTPNGYLITGRKKHLFVTLGGTVVSPARLEKLLKESDIIEDACVVGDKMPYLAVLLVLKPESYANYGLAPQQITEQVDEIIGNLNETLPRNVTLKKFIILDKPFSEANGEKLANGEINRLKIQETRAALIASLY